MMRRPSGAHRHRSHRTLMSRELVDAGAGLEVPHRHGLVIGPGDDAAAIRAHRHRTHPILVSGELVDAGAGFEVPHRHGLVVGPGDDVAAVGAHRNRTSPRLGVRRVGGCGRRIRGPTPPRSCRRTRRRCGGRPGSPPPNSPHPGVRRVGGCGRRTRGPTPPRCGRRTRRRCDGRRGSPPPNSPQLGARRAEWMRAPDSRSQTATVLSSDPETMRRPSGLTATELTPPWCPVRRRTRAGDSLRVRQRSRRQGSCQLAKPLLGCFGQGRHPEGHGPKEDLLGERIRLALRVPLPEMMGFAPDQAEHRREGLVNGVLGTCGEFPGHCQALLEAVDPVGAGEVFPGGDVLERPQRRGGHRRGGTPRSRPGT